MSMPPGGGMEPLTRDDLRRLEARLGARMQEVAARVIRHDGQFAALGERIDLVDRRCDALSARIDSRLHRIDRRFDSMETRLDTSDGHMREMLNEVKAGRRHQTKMTMYGVAGSTLATGTLCLGTFVMFI